MPPITPLNLQDLAAPPGALAVTGKKITVKLNVPGGYTVQYLDPKTSRWVRMPVTGGWFFQAATVHLRLLKGSQVIIKDISGRWGIDNPSAKVAAGTMVVYPGGQIYFWPTVKSPTRLAVTPRIPIGYVLQYFDPKTNKWVAMPQTGGWFYRDAQVQLRVLKGKEAVVGNFPVTWGKAKTGSNANGTISVAATGAVTFTAKAGRPRGLLETPNYNAASTSLTQFFRSTTNKDLRVAVAAVLQTLAKIVDKTGRDLPGSDFLTQLVRSPGQTIILDSTLRVVGQHRGRDRTIRLSIPKIAEACERGKFRLIDEGVVAIATHETYHAVQCGLLWPGADTFAHMDDATAIQMWNQMKAWFPRLAGDTMRDAGAAEARKGLRLLYRRTFLEGVPASLGGNIWLDTTKPQLMRFYAHLKAGILEKHPQATLESGAKLGALTQEAFIYEFVRNPLVRVRTAPGQAPVRVYDQLMPELVHAGDTRLRASLSDAVNYSSNIADKLGRTAIAEDVGELELTEAAVRWKQSGIKLLPQSAERAQQALMQLFDATKASAQSLVKAGKITWTRYRQWMQTLVGSALRAGGGVLDAGRVEMAIACARATLGELARTASGAGTWVASRADQAVQVAAEMAATLRSWGADIIGPGAKALWKTADQAGQWVGKLAGTLARSSKPLAEGGVRYLVELSRTLAQSAAQSAKAGLRTAAAAGVKLLAVAGAVGDVAILADVANSLLKGDSKAAAAGVSSIFTFLPDLVLGAQSLITKHQLKGLPSQFPWSQQDTQRWAQLSKTNPLFAALYLMGAAAGTVAGKVFAPITHYTSKLYAYPSDERHVVAAGYAKGTPMMTVLSDLATRKLTTLDGLAQMMQRAAQGKPANLADYVTLDGPEGSRLIVQAFQNYTKWPAILGRQAVNTDDIVALGAKGRPKFVYPMLDFQNWIAGGKYEEVNHPRPNPHLPRKYHIRHATSIRNAAKLLAGWTMAKGQWQHAGPLGGVKAATLDADVKSGTGLYRKYLESFVVYKSLGKHWISQGRFQKLIEMWNGASLDRNQQAAFNKVFADHKLKHGLLYDVRANLDALDRILGKFTFSTTGVVIRP